MLKRILIKYVGKEVTNLDATNVLGVNGASDNCTVYDNIEEKIIQIRPKDAYKIGISRSNLISIQKKIRCKTGAVLKLHKMTIQKIIADKIIMARGGDVI